MPLARPNTLRATPPPRFAGRAETARLVLGALGAKAAQAAAEAAAQEAADLAASGGLASSWVDPLNILVGSASGGITIAAHTRHYADGANVSVNSGSLSGFSPGDYVTVYYDDANRTGGAVTYQGSTAVIAQSGARHVVGGVQIPVSGSLDGYGPYPPGYVPYYWY